MPKKTTEDHRKPLGSERSEGSLAADIMEIGKRCAALPDLVHRSAEEILDYDENGLPS